MRGRRIGMGCWLCLAGLMSAAERPSVSIDTWTYFKEIVFAGEFQDLEPMVRKWNQPVRVRLFGDYHDADLNTLFQVLGELKRLTDGRLRWEVVDEDHNLAVHFIPENTFSRYAPVHESDVQGYFMISYGDRGEIRTASVLVSTNPKLTRAERDHLIREEITQALGLINDSPRYPDSIFQVAWTDTRSYAPIDEALIRLLYHPAVKSGMSERELVRILSFHPESRPSAQTSPAGAAP